MSTLLQSSQANLRRYADLAGATASGVCLLHCLFTPVAISLFPDILPYLPGDAWFHRALAVGILMLGAAAFVPGYRIHRRRSLAILVAAGISAILIVAWTAKTLNPTAQVILSVAGSLMLISAHLLNHSFCRQCRSCKELTRCQTTNL